MKRKNKLQKKDKQQIIYNYITKNKGWVDTMLAGIDTRRPMQQPRRDKNMWATVFATKFVFSFCFTIFLVTYFYVCVCIYIYIYMTVKTYLSKK